MGAFDILAKPPTIAAGDVIKFKVETPENRFTSEVELASGVLLSLDDEYMKQSKLEATEVTSSTNTSVLLQIISLNNMYFVVDTYLN